MSDNLRRTVCTLDLGQKVHWTWLAIHLLPRSQPLPISQHMACQTPFWQKPLLGQPLMAKLHRASPCKYRCLHHHQRARATLHLQVWWLAHRMPKDMLHLCVVWIGLQTFVSVTFIVRFLSAPLDMYACPNYKAAQCTQDWYQLQNRLRSLSSLL